jgi:hypothetical protein
MRGGDGFCSNSKDRGMAGRNGILLRLLLLNDLELIFHMYLFVCLLNPNSWSRNSPIFFSFYNINFHQDMTYSIRCGGLRSTISTNDFNLRPRESRFCCVEGHMQETISFEDFPRNSCPSIARITVIYSRRILYHPSYPHTYYSPGTERKYMLPSGCWEYRVIYRQRIFSHGWEERQFAEIRFRVSAKWY